MSDAARRRKPVLGFLGLFLGGLGVLVCLCLLAATWWSFFWVKTTTTEFVDTTAQSLEQARTRLLESERRVQLIRTACESLKNEIQESIQNQIGLDEETRSKLVDLSIRLQKAQVEIRLGLQNTQAVLLLSHGVLSGAQERIESERLDGLLALILELESITRSMAQQLDKLGDTADSARAAIQDLRDQRIARADAKLDEVAKAIDDALLTATDAANRSAEFVTQLREELRALQRQVVGVTLLAGLGLSFLFVWNLMAQSCLAKSGWKSLAHNRNRST